RAVPKAALGVDGRKKAAPIAVAWQPGHSTCPAHSAADIVTNWPQVGHRPRNESSGPASVIIGSDGVFHAAREGPRGAAAWRRVPAKPRARGHLGAAPAARASRPTRCASRSSRAPCADEAGAAVRRERGAAGWSGEAVMLGRRRRLSARAVRRLLLNT